MDSVNRDGGQSLALAVLLVAVAALALAGLRGAQERIIDRTRDELAGEGAVEAAGAVVADALAAGTLEAVVRDERVLARARMAAVEIAAANGRGRPEGLRLVVVPGGAEVSLTLAGHVHRAAIVGVEVACCPR